MNTVFLRHQAVPSNSTETLFDVPEVKQLDFHWIFTALRRGARLILASLAFGIALASLYLLFATPRYEATIRLLFSSVTSNTVNSQAKFSSAAADETDIQSQVEMLRLPHIAERVIRKLGLAAGSPENDAVLPPAAIKSFLDRLQVKRIGISNIIEVRYADAKRSRALEIANAIPEAYHDAQTEAKYAAGEKTIAGLENRVDELQDQVLAYEERIHQYTLKRNRVQVSKLKREAKATNELYAILLARQKEMEARQNLNVANAQVVAPAVAPIRPSHPRWALILGLGLVGGLGVGVALAFLRKLTENVFRTRGDVDRVLGINTLSVLPCLCYTDPLEPKEAGGRPVLSVIPETFRNKKCDSKSAELRTDLMQRFIVNDSSSLYTQSIITIRDALDHAGPRDTSKVVAIVSALPGEGKSMVAVNLADCAAEAGRSTLLVDCDLRDPTLTRILSPKSNPSLADILAGKTSQSSAIKRDSPTGFALCPSPRGRVFQRPEKILSSPWFGDFLNDMRDQYDLVILDTSALLTFVDARALIKHADLVMMLVECNRATFDQVRMALRQAAIPREKLLGVVLNKVSADGSNELIIGRGEPDLRAVNRCWPRSVAKRVAV